jgi:hypothetical protein
VNVKMTQNGPQLDDGQNRPVVIKDAPSRGGVASGGLPMVQVKMTQSGPQVQTETNVQGGPPQIPAAPPALSAPRVVPMPRQGYVARPAYPVVSQARVASVARVAAPQPTVQAAAPAALPMMPELTADQLMLCRHLAEKYLAEVRTDAVDGADSEVEDSDAAKLAAATIVTIDDALAVTTARIEAAVLAAAAPAIVSATSTIAAPAATSISPAPSVAYDAGRVGGRSYVAGGVRSQRNARLAPRSTPRDAASPPLPPVVVKMEGERAVVQNRAEVEQAKAVAAAAPAPEASPAPETPAADVDPQD